MPIHKVYRSEIVVKEEITEVQCNKCGESIDMDGWSMGSGHSFLFQGGFSSAFPGDMVTCGFVLCDGCLEAFTESFVVPADLSGGYGEVLPYRAKRASTGEEVIVDWGWVRDASIPEEDFWAKGRWEALEQRAHEIMETTEIEWPLSRNGQPALFEHFKGGLYQVIEVFLFEVGTEEPLIAYRALYGDSQVWVRPVAEFEECVERGSYKGPRFRRLQ